MIDHNRRITDKHNKADRSFYLFITAVFTIVFLLGYVLWDFYEAREVFKSSEDAIAVCLNGKPIMVDGVKFTCNEINLKEKK